MQGGSRFRVGYSRRENAGVRDGDRIYPPVIGVVPNDPHTVASTVSPVASANIELLTAAKAAVVAAKSTWSTHTGRAVTCTHAAPRTHGTSSHTYTRARAPARRHQNGDDRAHKVLASKRSPSMQQEHFGLASPHASLPRMLHAHFSLHSPLSAWSLSTSSTSQAILTATSPTFATPAYPNGGRGGKPGPCW